MRARRRSRATTHSRAFIAYRDASCVASRSYATLVRMTYAPTRIARGAHHAALLIDTNRLYAARHRLDAHHHRHSAYFSSRISTAQRRKWAVYDGVGITLKRGNA